MKTLLRSIFLLVIICMGSTFFYLRCIACRNDVATVEYIRMATEIVEQSLEEKY